MPVFHLAKEPDDQGFSALSKKDQHHLTAVLRIKAGESFEVRFPDGKKARAELIRAGKGWRAKIAEILTTRAPSPLPVWLGLGWIRWPRLEWVIEKATELGLERLSLLNLSRSQSFPKSREIPKKMARLERIAAESLKQCERMTPPRIDPPQSLKEFLAAQEKQSGPSVKKIFFHERQDTLRFSPEHLARTPSESWVVAIGPEGGWTEDEAKVLLEHGFKEFSLGLSIYRTETAAIYALACIDFFQA